MLCQSNGGIGKGQHCHKAQCVANLKLATLIKSMIMLFALLRHGCGHAILLHYLLNHQPILGNKSFFYDYIVYRKNTQNLWVCSLRTITPPPPPHPGRYKKWITFRLITIMGT